MMQPERDSGAEGRTALESARPVVRYSLAGMLDVIGESFDKAGGPDKLLDQDEISRLFKQPGKAEHEPPRKPGVS